MVSKRRVGRVAGGAASVGSIAGKGSSSSSDSTELLGPCAGLGQDTTLGVQLCRSRETSTSAKLGTSVKGGGLSEGSGSVMGVLSGFQQKGKSSGRHRRAARYGGSVGGGGERWRGSL